MFWDFDGGEIKISTSSGDGSVIGKIDSKRDGESDIKNNRKRVIVTEYRIKSRKQLSKKNGRGGANIR